INAFTLWKPAAVKITQGTEFLGQFAKTERSLRKFCTRCGGHVMADHPMFGLLDIYASMLPTLPFKASAHVNYGETVLRISDGLPKFKDFPAAMGGSGTMLGE
ncbi:MAG TPA: hypothetical protein VFS47_17630, partial [Steroidobacteraceae bacterium]|nr:hypothetical protein [Steroidobacteraceae bacterium]